MSESGGNQFPHDGEHGANCTGYGCNCDEKNYGSPGRGPNGDRVKFVLIMFVVVALLGTVSEALALIIGMGLLFYVLFIL